MVMPLVEGFDFFKTVNDPIHGHITLDLNQLMFIDTPQFQRLRDLKQLGSSCFVFPGGTHTRFEHSIGVSYLADRMVTSLHHKQPELELTERDITCVKLAGLCHDLGHGPFSHVFDAEFIPRVRPGLNWTHEQGSELMLDYLVDENHIDIDQADIRFIKDLISGAPSSSAEQREKAFLFDIVANKRNGVDVDKFDYLQRDCHTTGITSSYDSSRLILLGRVIDNQICYSSKEVFNIYDLFQTRYSLFKRVYTHKVAKAIEYMIVDALAAADPYLGISEGVAERDMEKYSRLTDHLLRQIENSREPELKKARDIVTRIRKRQLYKFVEQYTMPHSMKRYLKRDMITPRIILSYHDGSIPLSEDDIIVNWSKINYGMAGTNPVDHILFYGKFNSKAAFHIEKQQVSYLVPEEYEEIIIRVFARDPDKVPVVQRCVRKCLESVTQPIVNLRKMAQERGYRSEGASPLRHPDGDHVLASSPTFASSNAASSRDQHGELDVHVITHQFDQSGLSESSHTRQSTGLESVSSTEDSTGRFTEVKPFEPNQAHNVPDMAEWTQMSAKYGWSPNKKASEMRKKVRHQQRNSDGGSGVSVGRRFTDEFEDLNE